MIPFSRRSNSMSTSTPARAGSRSQGVAECHGEPIKNPVTGAEHRARIDIPHGFEYELAEMGSGTRHDAGQDPAEPEGQLRSVRPSAPQQPRRRKEPRR